MHWVVWILGTVIGVGLMGCGADGLDGENTGLDDTAVVWDYDPDPDVENYFPTGYRATNPQRVVFMGDSITAGVGSSSSSGSYVHLILENMTSEWPDHDDEDLESLYPNLTDVIDVSRGGATTGSLLNGQLSDLSDELGTEVAGETIVVVTVGGNDMQSAIPMVLFGGDAAGENAISGVIENMEEMLDYFDDTTRFPDGVFVYLANVYEPTDGTGYVSNCFFGQNLSSVWHHFEAANSAIRDLAESRDIALVDISAHFQGHGYHATDSTNAYYHGDDPTTWFSSDCIHPNDRGHHELRRVFMAAIEGRPLAAL